LPPDFPRRLISLFEDYGESLREDEWIEQTPSGWNKPVRYDATSRNRLHRLLDSAYEDHIDLTGHVTMARVTTRAKMAVELADGREIEVAFRPEDEETIIAALKDHATAKLRVIGKGAFAGTGLLQRVVDVSSITLLVGGQLPYDNSVRPIWEEIEEIISQVPEEEWDKLPTDGAENHDRYITRQFRGE
jgi:hypothetical protein